MMVRKQSGPVYPNYREALRAAFGNSADNIPGVDPTCGTLRDVPVYGLRLILSNGTAGPDKQGRPFVLCGGGEVLGGMDAADEATKLVFYLVRDGGSGRAWDLRQRELRAIPSREWTEEQTREFHTPRPSAQYKVVASI